MRTPATNRHHGLNPDPRRKNPAMTTSAPSTTGTGPAWVQASDVQCLDDEWADDNHDDGTQLHVYGLITDHDGDCLCITERAASLEQEEPALRARGIGLTDELAESIDEALELSSNGLPVVKHWALLRSAGLPQSWLPTSSTPRREVCFSVVSGELKVRQS